jgi:hypothetical protein
VEAEPQEVTLGTLTASGVIAVKAVIAFAVVVVTPLAT